MKKLLVTAIGAAVAFGAFAAPVSSQRFEEATERGPIELSGLNTLAGGNYWSDTRGATTNTYEIEAFGSYVQPTSLGAPTNALKVATKFGQPLEVKSKLGVGESIGDGLYFDSLVKFTVCDDDPSEDICTNAYKDAKIVMWLKENEDQTKTNIMVRAGYLSIDNNDKVQVVSKTYDCGTIDLDIDKFHRVTIKAIENITTTRTISMRSSRRWCRLVARRRLLLVPALMVLVPSPTLSSRTMCRNLRKTMVRLCRM